MINSAWIYFCDHKQEKQNQLKHLGRMIWDRVIIYPNKNHNLIKSSLFLDETVGPLRASSGSERSQTKA